MKYWRMQLHPSDPSRAAFHAAQSLSAGFIGLDFSQDVGDLKRVQKNTLPAPQQDYCAFAHDMAIGDRVLVMVHHFPFALVTVTGEYNYIRDTAPQIGVWFRHFRSIDKEKVLYYADKVINANSWQKITMTDTISVLNDPNSRSYQLIQSLVEQG
jgi:hypothetical protein